MRFGFCGFSYKSPSPLADAEELINWYVEQPESPNARTAGLLLPTPGLVLFANLSAVAGVNFPSVRALETFQGRTFAVAGTHLLELTASGVTDYGGSGGNNNIIDDGNPATMVCGGTIGGAYPSQVLIASGGTLTVFSLASDSFQALTTPPTNVLMVDFLAGFFCALQQGNTWSVSNAEDATTWPGTSVAQVSVYSDQLLALRECNEFIWLLGAKHITAYYVSGAPLFPFDVQSGGVLNAGIYAQYSAARVMTKSSGKYLVWLGGEDQGVGVIWAVSGNVPQRVSDHGFENWFHQQLAAGVTMTDAVGWGEQYQGHNFYKLWFPTAGVTWVLDMDLGGLFKLASTVQGAQAAHLGRCHTFNFGTHLVGDRSSGNVYAMLPTAYTDNGQPIVRTRIGPSISQEGGQLTLPINEFQVDVESGLGPEPPLVDGFGNPRDPLMMVSYSEDFGKTWTPERMLPCGQAGNSKMIAIDRRLGSWRNWTPKVTVSDPIPWRIVDAYTNSTQDEQQRYAKSIAKIT